MNTVRTSCLAALILPFGSYGAITPNSGYLGRNQAPPPTVQKCSESPRMPQIQTPTERTHLTTPQEVCLEIGQAVAELIIIDASVPDKHLFYQELKPGTDVIELNEDSDGLEQLLTILERYKSLNALHIVSHADAGVIQLGNSQVSTQSLEGNIQAFSQINTSIKPGGDLLFYGCNLAKGSEGDEFLELIVGNTHVDVAASNNLTGSAAKNGDWELEVKKGDIETQKPFSDLALRDFSDVLAPQQYIPSDFCIGGGCAVSTPSHTSSDGHIDFSGSHNIYAFDGTYADSGFYLDYGTPATTGHLRFAADGTNIASFQLTAVNFSAKGGASCSTAKVIGYLVGGGTNEDSFTLSGSGGVTLTNLSGDQLTEFRVYATGCDQKIYWPIRLNNFTVDNKLAPIFIDSDGTLTATGGVTEPVNIPTTASSGSPVNVFDFTIADGGGSDGFTLDVSQININLSGSASANFSKLRFNLTGCATKSNIAPSASTVSFTSTAISITNGGNSVCTVAAYWADPTGITDKQTITMTIDGDTDLTIDTNKTNMSGSNTAVATGDMSTEVTASKLIFTTQPSN